MYAFGMSDDGLYTLLYKYENRRKKNCACNEKHHQRHMRATLSVGMKHESTSMYHVNALVLNHVFSLLYYAEFLVFFCFWFWFWF